MIPLRVIVFLLAAVLGVAQGANPDIPGRDSMERGIRHSNTCLSAPETAGRPQADDLQTAGVTTSVAVPRLIAECVAPLQSPFQLPLQLTGAGAWPLVLWDSGEPDAWDAAAIDVAAARGIVPAIRLDSRWLSLARLLQSAGRPVVVIEGRGSAPPWPYHLGGADDEWALRFADGAQIPQAWRNLPVPTRLEGWAVAATELRTRLTKFKQAGIDIAAFWMDYENQPATLDYAAVKGAVNMDGLVPPEALHDETAFAAFRRQLWLTLVSTYVAAPIREIYPRAAVTNWLALVSTPDAPTHSWRGEPHPPTSAGLFSHTNPVSYGVDYAFLAYHDGALFNPRPNVIDGIYLHLMLRQASEDAANRRRIAPWLGSLAWVARWVPDMGDARVPVMSRRIYREALRHLWLRDIDAMAVFNHLRAGHAAYQLAEIQDAVRVYDEMLGWRAQVEKGEAMSFAVPPPWPLEPLWSGLRNEQRALIRVFNPLGTEESVHIALWPGIRVEIVAAPGGATYLLKRTAPEALEVQVLARDLTDE